MHQAENLLTAETQQNCRPEDEWNLATLIGNAVAAPVNYAGTIFGEGQAASDCRIPAGWSVG